MTGAAVPRATLLHQRGVAATAGGRPAVGARLLRDGLRLLGWHAGRKRAPTGPGPGAGADPLAARLLISLGYAEAELGRTRYGFELLDAAAAVVDPADEGVLLQQRGLMLFRTGRFEPALSCLDGAVPLLATADRTVVLGRTLLNRSALLLRLGRVRAAREDLDRCAELADRHGLALLAAKASHNRGYCDLLAGDVPAALAAFGAARERYATHAPGLLPVLTAARARALLAAGLAVEAGRQLDDAVAEFRRQRLSQEQAEAELLRAQAALDAASASGVPVGVPDPSAAFPSRPAVAAGWAARAERRFQRRGNHAWAALAALTRLRADFVAGRRGRRFAARAERLATRLISLGLPRDAELAHLLAIRAAPPPAPATPNPRPVPGNGPNHALYPGHFPEMAGRGVGPEAAGRGVGSEAAGRGVGSELAGRGIGRGRGADLETRLMRRLTRAELAGRAGRYGPALDELRAGLAELQRHRSRFGSIDLQAGVAALGRELAVAGLGAVLAHGSARSVFAWSERMRAQAFRVPPVRLPGDPETAELLAELRQVRHLVRTAELERRREPAAHARCVELERAIRERTWEMRGPGESEPEVGAAPVLTALGKDRAMVSLLQRDGRLSALVLHNGAVRMVPLGAADVAAEAALRLLADLDALAARGVPDRMAAAVRASVAARVEALTEHVVAGLRHLLSDVDELIVVPTTALASVPWHLLPDLAGRAVTVCASAGAWLRARRSVVDGPLRRVQKTVLVSGPHLSSAETEIAEISHARPGSVTLTGPSATVAATLRGLDGAAVAHIAAHGHHERESVLFSRLDLVDGPLMAYDIQGLAEPPHQVTLSACDVGRSVMRPGDEMLGFTAALLYAGTASVVSSVARVTHQAAAEVMTRHHRGVASGEPPARALARALAGWPDAPFVCFGAG